MPENNAPAAPALPPTPDYLAAAGYRIHRGPTDSPDPGLIGRYWWTHSAPGCDVATDPGDWATPAEAIRSARLDCAEQLLEHVEHVMGMVDPDDIRYAGDSELAIAALVERSKDVTAFLDGTTLFSRDQRTPVAATNDLFQEAPAPTSAEQRLRELAIATRRMRELQRQYFKDRDRAILIASKDAEKAVDQLTAKELG